VNFIQSLVYTGFQFIQGSSLYRIPVYTGFQFIQDSSLFRVRFRQVSLYQAVFQEVVVERHGNLKVGEGWTAINNYYNGILSSWKR